MINTSVMPSSSGLVFRSLEEAGSPWHLLSLCLRHRALPLLSRCRHLIQQAQPRVSVAWIGFPV
jgi:hypothetical protein